MTETWKQVINHDGYLISSHGRIKNLNTGYILKSSAKGYQYARIGNEKKLIHRWVAIHFLDNPNELNEVNHKNGIKTDNRVENLEWVTHTENIHHAVNMGLMNHIFRSGKDHHFFGKNISKQTRDKMSKSRNDKKMVIQFSQDFKKINEYESTNLAAKITGISRSGISQCANGTIKTYKGFVWKFS